MMLQVYYFLGADFRMFQKVLSSKSILFSCLQPSESERLLLRLIGCTITHKYTHTHTLTNTHAYTHTYIHTDTHTHTHPHTHTHTHTQTHTHTHTQFVFKDVLTPVLHRGLDISSSTPSSLLSLSSREAPGVGLTPQRVRPPKRS